MSNGIFGKLKKLRFFWPIVALGIIVFSSAAIGFPGYKSQLPDSGETFGCGTCHVGQTTSLNDFGKDFQANGYAYDSALSSSDSDGDDYTNDEEFNAGPITNPGDASSHPTETVEPPAPKVWDWVPWLLTIITGIVMILGISLILIMIATKNKPKGENET